MVAARLPPRKAAPEPAGCCTRAGCFSCMRATRRPFVRVGGVIRTSPTVLLVPFLLFACCVIGGVIAVRYAANSYAAAEKTKALSLVNTATTVRPGDAGRRRARVPHRNWGARAGGTREQADVHDPPAARRAPWAAARR